MEKIIKKAIFIILLAIWKNPVLGEVNICSVDSYGLHPFWSQQYTGGDLLRKKLEQLQDFKVPDNLFQIWDSDRNLHGEYVAQLIAGPHLSASIPLEKHSDYTPIMDIVIRKKPHYDFMNCLEQDSCPSYINISMSFPTIIPFRMISNIIDLIDRAKITVIFSSDNQNELMDPMKRRYARRQGIVSVSNCGFDGNPYDDSSYAPEITVCAPSGGSHVISCDFTGNFKSFGGSSGAAPQVTAALVAFTAITKYALNPQEAIALLKKTAIPHPRLPNNSNMGAGMVNTWKIGEVAFKLQKLCGENNSCYTRKLLEEDTFTFSVNKQKLIGRASNIFPLCSGSTGRGGSFLEQEEMLEDLRKAALLDPYDGQLWSLLACINKRKCLRAHAEYYNSLAERADKTDRELVDEILQNGDYLFASKYLLLSDKETTEKVLAGLKKLSSAQDLDPLILKELVDIVTQNLPEDIPHYNEVLHMIAKEPSIEREDLENLGNYIIKNMKNIFDPYNLLEMITGHQKITSNSLAEFANNIIENAEIIPEHYELLEMMVNHPAIEPYRWKMFHASISKNAENISNHHKLLEIIENKIKMQAD